MEYDENDIEYLNAIEVEEDKIPSKGGNIIPFIQTLYTIVQDPSNAGYIRWAEDDGGKSFIIRDAIVFSRELLPKYYKHTNFCGFSRQLSLYGFRKSDDEYRYQNDYFMRDNYDLLKNIQRRKPQSQRKKQNNTTTLYHELLTQLMNLQKQNLDTISQINTLKEMLFQLKIREENLEMKMQRLQDTLFMNSNGYSMGGNNPFGNFDMDIPFFPPSSNQNSQNFNNQSNGQTATQNSNPTTSTGATNPSGPSGTQGINTEHITQANTQGQTSGNTMNSTVGGMQRIMEESMTMREGQRQNQTERPQVPFPQWNNGRPQQQLPWKF